MHSLTFNGVNSADLNVRIERSPRIIRPRRKTTVLSIPGRSGDIVMMEDAWENYDQPYDIFFGTGADLSAEAAADAVSAWLHSASDYARLEDTFEPDIYRLAYFVESLDMYNALTEFARVTIHLNCRPERYLISGETAVPFAASGGSINNPTTFQARPLIRVNGSGSGTLTISGQDKTYSVSLSNISSYMYLDCDRQNAYRTLADNQNANVEITQGVDYPRLQPGTNLISWSGGITSIEITPRWYRI